MYHVCTRQHSKQHTKITSEIFGEGGSMINLMVQEMLLRISDRSNLSTATEMAGKHLAKNLAHSNYPITTYLVND